MIDNNSFQNDLNEIKNNGDVFTILNNIGYFAYDETKSEVFIPNKEIMTVFYSTIKAVSFILRSFKSKLNFFIILHDLNQIFSSKMMK